MTRELFRHATEDKQREKRWEYTASFDRILKDPDEVWQRLNNKGGKLETEFIKYFDGKAIVVRVDKNQKAWSIHTIKPEQENSLRSGQLIYIKR